MIDCVTYINANLGEQDLPEITEDDSPVSIVDTLAAPPQFEGGVIW